MERVIPGAAVPPPAKAAADGVRLGQGLRLGDEGPVATLVGRVRRRGQQQLWIEGSQRRYSPLLEDHVLGIVEDRLGPEHYRVNVFGQGYARLPLLAFEGATKRNKPNLGRGALVFCRVAAVPGVLEPELSCISRDAVGRKDWMTGEGLFGELQGGVMIRCGTGLCRHLLRPDCPVLLRLAKQLPFEVAVGANGAVWVRAATARETCLVANAVRSAERLSEAEVAAMVSDLVRSARQLADIEHDA